MQVVAKSITEPAESQEQKLDANSTTLLAQLTRACDDYTELSNATLPPVEPGLIIEGVASAWIPAEQNTEETTAARNKNADFIQLIPWGQITGISSVEKAESVVDSLQQIAQLSELRIAEILKCPGAAAYIPAISQLTFTHGSKDLSANSNLDEVAETRKSIVSTALSRYRSIVLRLGFGPADDANEISDQLVERTLRACGTCRTVPCEQKHSIPRLWAGLLLELTQSSMQADIVMDLLHLADGGKITPIASRREAIIKLDSSRELDEKFADHERDLNNFFAAINWSSIDGAGAIARVRRFLSAAEEVRASSLRHQKTVDYTGAYGQWIAAHLRGKKLARLDFTTHFGASDQLPQDPDSLLRRNVALRGTFRTQARPGTPYLSSYYAESILKTAKVRLGDRMILSDIWNLVHGGEIVAQSLWKKYLITQFRLKDKSEDLLEVEIETHSKIIEQLRNINWKDLPGENARAKAVTGLLLLAKACGAEVRGESVLYEVSLGQNSSRDDVASRINRAVSAAKDMSEPERELLVQALGRSHQAGEGHFELTAQVLSLEMLSSQLLAHVGKIARVLGLTSHFGPSNSRPRPTPIDAWDEVAALDELNQLREALPSELIQAAELPDLFALRFQTAPPLGLQPPQLRSAKHAGKEIQLLYMLIDCSGSMNEPSRIGTAVALLTNRLVAVSRGDASLYYRFFDSAAHSEVSATDKNGATSALASVMRGHYSGGGTSIDTAIRSGVTGIERILKDNPLIKPELNIVSDGEDSVRIGLPDLHGIKLHVFLVGGRRNEKLERLALASGGMVLCIAADGAVAAVREHP